MRCKICDYTGNSSQEQSHYHRSLRIHHRNKGIVSYYDDLKDFYCLECAGSILGQIKKAAKSG
jgi:hypothetical protein